VVFTRVLECVYKLLLYVLIHSQAPNMCAALVDCLACHVVLQAYDMQRQALMALLLLPLLLTSPLGAADGDVHTVHLKPPPPPHTHITISCC
jgi:hypothetical protein